MWKYSFFYDGKRINDNNTPASLEMEDNGSVLFYFFIPRASSLLTHLKNPDSRRRSHGHAYVVSQYLLSVPFFFFFLDLSLLRSTRLCRIQRLTFSDWEVV